MTVQLTFRTSPLGKRYALYRVKGYGNGVWHGISTVAADRAVVTGVVPFGRLKGALAELVEGK